MSDSYGSTEHFDLTAARFLCRNSGRLCHKEVNALLKINSTSGKELAMRNVLSISAVLGALVFVGISDGTAFAKGAPGGHGYHGSYGNHGHHGRYGHYRYHGHYGSWFYPSYGYTYPSYSDSTYSDSTYSDPTYSDPTYGDPTYGDPTFSYASYGYAGYRYPHHGYYKSGFGFGSDRGHGLAMKNMSPHRR